MVLPDTERFGARHPRAADAPISGAGAAVSGAETAVPRRAALEHLLDHTEARLLVVRGPAGFGKTSLLRQFAARAGERGDRVAWLRLDSHSSDPAQFLRLLHAAVAASQGGDADGGSESEEAPSVPDVAAAAGAFDGRVLIIIDNYESAAGPGLDAVVTQLLRSVPDNVQLCLGTRALTLHGVARMRLQGEIAIVDAADLRFRPEETAEFFREFANLPAEEVARIHRQTDGWPAALQCFRLCLRGGRDRRGLAYAGGGVNPELIEYLATDVFDLLDADLQTLLLDICLPEKLNGALVAHLTGRDDGGERLAEVERAGLFLAPIDMRGEWYRFHTLFREFLLARLRRSVSEDELRDRHRRIAEWYAAHGHNEEAVQHMLEAGEHERAAALLAPVIDRLVAQERLGLIARYADRLPEAVLLRHEGLADAAVIAYSFLRAFDKANALLEARRRELDAAGADDRARGLHNYTQLFLLVAEDRVRELGEVGEEMEQQLDDADGFKFAVSLNARALWYVARGDFEEARTVLQRAAPLHDQDQSLFGRAYQEAVAGMALASQGRTRDAIRGLSRALQHTEAKAAGGVTAGSAMAAYLAANQYEVNAVAEAESLIDDYAQVAEQQAIVDPLAVMSLTRSRIHFLRERYAEAEDEIERTLYLGYRHELRRIVFYMRAELVRQATLRGDLELAERRLHDLPAAGELDRGGELLFFAGETEAHTVTQARFLIASGRQGQARSLLQDQIRRAARQRRRRREAKLRLMLALSMQAQSSGRNARRALSAALELGMPDEFVRSVLDEGPAAVRLLKETRESLPDLPELVANDAFTGYLDLLLAEAGETPGEEAVEEAPPPEAAELLEHLTERELEILRQVARGLSNKDLADRLSLSTNTVKWHLKNIFEKLHINNRIQAVTVARHYGLLN